LQTLGPALITTGIVTAVSWWLGIGIAIDSREPEASSVIARATAELAQGRTEDLTAHTLREEGVRLYAAGQFPMACERFDRAAEHEPASTARRRDLAGCFEGWAWQAMRDGRAEEAILLFRRGLRAMPDAPDLLTGLGVAAIHAGRAGEALEPLERAVTADARVPARLLLARLYDQRDDARQALAHLRAVVATEPEHEGARRLLGKIERELQAESGFRRMTTPHFLIKYRGAREAEARRVLPRLLEATYERVGSQLGYRPLDRVTVVLYEDAEFRHVAGVHTWVSGLFDGKIRLPLGPALPLTPRLERLLAHEYGHAAVHDLSRGRAPRWLQEGLAQVLEGARPASGLRVLDDFDLAGLDALIADADPARARVGYDVALWIVRDLLTRGGTPPLRALLTRLAMGEPVAAVIPGVYGLRLAELESYWRQRLGA
jgi:tetratricopeptide (TPR) repeat protein